MGKKKKVRPHPVLKKGKIKWPDESVRPLRRPA